MMAPHEGERLQSTVTLSNSHGQPHYSPNMLVGGPSLKAVTEGRHSNSVLAVAARANYMWGSSCST
jgi:hypothetical protein